MRALFVILLLALLVWIALHQLSLSSGKESPLKKEARSLQVAAQATLRQIADRIEAFWASNGEYPSSLRQVLGYVPRDPWGREIRYSPSDDGFELRSAGPDGVFASQDDIVLRR